MLLRPDFGEVLDVLRCSFTKPSWTLSGVQAQAAFDTRQLLYNWAQLPGPSGMALPVLPITFTSSLCMEPELSASTLEIDLEKKQHVSSTPEGQRCEV